MSRLSVIPFYPVLKRIMLALAFLKSYQMKQGYPLLSVSLNRMNQGNPDFS